MRPVVRQRARDFGAARFRPDAHLHQVRVQLVRWPSLLRDLQAPPLRDDVYVDDVHMVFADRRQQTADDRRLQRRQVVLRDLPRVVDLDAPHLPLVQLHRQLAGLERHRHVRRQVAVRLGRDQRRVHRIARRLAPQHRHDLLGDVHRYPFLRLCSRCPEVRRHDDLVRLEQRVVGDRLLLENIDCGARDPPLVERLL